MVQTLALISTVHLLTFCEGTAPILDMIITLWVPRFHSLRIKQPGREADHSLTCFAQVKNDMNYICTDNFLPQEVMHKSQYKAKHAYITLPDELYVITGGKWIFSR